MDNSVKRGDIFYADLSPVVGSEQGGVRPVLIVQNDTGNRHSPTVIAAAITSQTGKARLPTHISVSPLSCGLPKESIILLEQVRTLDKRRLREKMGRLDENVMKQVDAAIAVSFGLHPETFRGYLKEHEPELYARQGKASISRGCMEKYAEAIHLYRTTTESINSIARRFGFNACSFRQYVQRHFPEAVKERKERNGK